MNLVGRLRAAKKAEAKAAATAPAQFRRITKRTKVTAPCVLALIVEEVAKDFWTARIVYEQSHIGANFKDYYTHWLPIEWPEVRG